MARVVVEWPKIKRKIVKALPGLYTLTLMELSVGSQEGTLVLSSPNAIYLDQLEASGGEKLKMIEQVIRDETGISARILTKDRAPEKKPEAHRQDAAPKPETKPAEKAETPRPEDVEIPDIPYDLMTVEQLQAVILKKMANNGPVTDRMRRDVVENIWHNSLVNWANSFR